MCVKCVGIVGVEEVRECCCEMKTHICTKVIFLLIVGAAMYEAIPLTLDLVFEQNGRWWTLVAQLTLQINRWFGGTIQPKLHLRMLQMSGPIEFE